MEKKLSYLLKSSELKAYISLRELPLEKPHSGFRDLTLSIIYDSQEKGHILKVLTQKKNNWNISKSATALGICKSSLWMKMKKHG